MTKKEIKDFRKTYTRYEKDCIFEGYALAVLFDEKDDVKRHGGRWDAGNSTWWMPHDKILEQIHDNGTLVRDWLNDNEMIMGQYGTVRKSQQFRLDATSGYHSYTEYGLYKSNNVPQYKFQFWYDDDVVKIMATGMGELPTEYLTIEDGRKRWDELTNAGYNRVENS